MSTLNRLVLWNIDHTLVDVGRVTREAYAEAFQRTIGRPLVRLAPTPGRTESEIIFETLAFNDVVTTDDHLPTFMAALVEAFATRRADLRGHGRVLAGAQEAVAALAHVPGVVQSVLTGAVQPNAVLKVTELGLADHLDLDSGGYENGVYSKAALLELARSRAGERHEARYPESATVYIADSPRDVQAAHIAGSPIIAVATGSATEAELRAAGADRVLATLADTHAVVSAVADLTRL
ncbi:MULTISPECIES: HAD family hydrolase [Actinomadura]|uniref:HAD hydrolase-like protein n=1 Tax=Actinomadura litoris TaxID=2678616 RepID=A0A7K1KWS1_9ACTN|nr:MULTISPECIES: haloacid dehalogenase-like hydrolase [Actinomadura]MBT2210748.1 haloacid dehalogenase-like hydrolase [Actinomadura sp. NEAU-AAG7]MUN36648.1 HAD hydrolase-like protein [Actinomadura litoris]